MTFDDWYEQYEHDGNELLLFNTIDLDAAFCAGIEEGKKMTKFEFLNTEQVLELLPISRMTFRRLVKEGSFPARANLGTKKWLWFADDIEDWLSKRTQSTV